MLRTLEADKELAAYLELRAPAAVLDSPDAAASPAHAALRALIDTQRGLAEMNRAFPQPTEFPEEALFDRESFDAQRQAERENAVNDAAVMRRLRVHEFTRPERQKGEDIHDFDDRFEVWSHERLRIAQQLSAYKAQAEAEQEAATAKAAEEQRTLEGFFSSQTDPLSEDVRSEQSGEQSGEQSAAAVNDLSDAFAADEARLSATSTRRDADRWRRDEDEEEDEDADVLPEEGSALDMQAQTQVYRVKRLAVVHLSERKVWLSEIWERPETDPLPEVPDDEGDEDLGQLGAPHLVREQVLDIPGDWLSLFKSVPWPSRTLRNLSVELEGHLTMSQGSPAIMAALNGQAPLE